MEVGKVITYKVELCNCALIIIGLDSDYRYRVITVSSFYVVDKI